MFPAAPAHLGLTADYAVLLADIRERISSGRLRTVLEANSAMVLLYWDIGHPFLVRQEKEGWGAKVIDRLSADLREAFPDMTALSPRNLKYMRSFAAAWPDPAIVQEALAHIPWYHQIALLEKCRSGSPNGRQRSCETCLAQSNPVSPPLRRSRPSSRLPSEL